MVIIRATSIGYAAVNPPSNVKCGRPQEAVQYSQDIPLAHNLHSALRRLCARGISWSKQLHKMSISAPPVLSQVSFLSVYAVCYYAITFHDAKFAALSLIVFLHCVL